MCEILSLYDELESGNKPVIVQELNCWGRKKDHLFNKSNPEPTVSNDYLHNHIMGINSNPSRIITTINDQNDMPKIWLYQSKHGESSINNNGEFFDEKGNQIVCRQLAFWFLWNDAVYSNILLKQETIKRNINSLYSNDYDNTKCTFNFNHLSAAPFEELGTKLQEECKNMVPGDEKHLILQTENHVMAFKVHYKSLGYFTVKFYDPNITTVHTRLVMRSPDDLQSLKITHLLSHEFINCYSPKFKMFALLRYDQANFVRPQTQSFNFPNITQAKLIQHAGLFHFAMRSGNKNYVQDFINVVVNFHGLDIRKKLKLLSAKDYEGDPGLYMALQEGHTGVVTVFINSILNSTALDEKQKAELLNAENHYGIPGLYMALQNGYTEIVTVFINSILNSTALDKKQIANLLSAKNCDGTSGLYMALQEGHTGVVTAFINSILNSTALDKKQIANLLSAKSCDGTSGLHMALQEGHTGVVTAFINSILNSDILDEQQIINLLSAKSCDGTSGLHMAFQNGHTEIVTVFINSILNSTALDEQAKVKLVVYI